MARPCNAVVCSFFALVACVVTPCRADLANTMRADDVLINQDAPPLSLKHDVTEQGCTCTSQCGASIDVALSACDWCWTDGGCGKWSLRGHWDFCVYPEMHGFEAQDHALKLDQLWSRLTAPDSIGKSAEPKSISGTVKQMASESMITTFDDQWEVMPAGRTKVIHTQGVHCQFDVTISPQSPFTGIFAPGNQKGMLRMGSASSLDTYVAPHGTPMFPGMGVKFLRSGVRSADFVALRSSGPGGSYNFFESGFSNHIAPPAELEALHKFQQASGCISMVGLSDACSYSQTGTFVSDPVFPFEIVFEPTGNINFSNVKKSNAELLSELSSIPVGTHLFELYTYASPKDRANETKLFLGSLSTSSKCVQSIFGDNDLFYRHQRMEEDFAMRPDWISSLDDEHCAASVGPISKWQCARTPTRQLKQSGIVQNATFRPLWVV